MNAAAVHINLADAGLEVMLAVEEGQHVDRALNEVGRRFRLRGEDRLLVKRWLHMTLRWRGRFDALLRNMQGPWTDPLCQSAARLALGSSFSDTPPGLLAALEQVLHSRGQRKAASLLKDIVPPADGRALEEMDGAPEALADACSHPQWMIDRLQADFPDEDLRAMLAANNAEPPVTLRVNTLRTDRDTLQKRLLEEGIETMPGAWSPLALHVTSTSDVFRSEAFRQGLFEMQDEGSQLLGLVADPKPRGLIIDACAGAGGKTLLMAGLLRNRARILAIDIYDNKLERLRERARRAGVSNTETRVLETGGVPPELHNAATTVFVDAPCTGLGALRRNPDAKWRLTPDAVDELAARQAALLSLWADAVAPGGLLVYATCTLTRAENEDVVARFLEQRPDYGVEPACLRFEQHGERFQTPEGYFRSFPHRDGTDGFFGVRLRRKG